MPQEMNLEFYCWFNLVLYIFIYYTIIIIIIIIIIIKERVKNSERIHTIRVLCLCGLDC